MLEIAGSRAGAVTAKRLAEFGASVTKLVPLERREVASGPHPPRHAPASRLVLDAGKRLEQVDLHGASGRDTLSHWLDRVDVSIESAAPGPLSPRPETADRPHLIRVLISPLGLEGPLAGWRSNDLTDEALAGHLTLNGEAGRPPIARPGRLSTTQAGLHALIGALAALRVRDATGIGQTVEVSHLEGLVALHQHTLTMWTHDRHRLRRSGNRQPGYWHPAGLYACRDGHVALHVAGQAVRDRLLVAAGLEALLLDPRFADDLALARHKDEFDAQLAPWLLAHDAEEIVRLLQSVNVPVGAVCSPREVLADPQLEADAGLVRIDDVVVPRSPIRISVPSDSEVEPGSGDANAPSRPLPRGPRASADARAARSGLADGPLHGLRVLDLGRIFAGPLAGRLLADLGADVVAIESPDARGGRQVPDGLAAVTHLFPDGEVGDAPWNRIGSINALGRNKRGVTLDLRRDAARDVFERLVAHADVVLENFHPAFLPALGLGFDRLRARNPRVVFASLSGFGAHGPSANHVAYGPIVEARSGVAHGMGERGGPPCRSGIAWPDPLAALHLVAGILAALCERDADPRARARRVEVSLHASALAICGELLVEAQRSGIDPPRRGARHPDHAPQGVYPCAGDDRWIAISVTSDAEWTALHRTLALDSALAGLDRTARRERHDEIDAAITGATAGRDPLALSRALQQAGVMAAGLFDARDLCENEQLAARDFWVDDGHPVSGPRREAGPAIRLSATPCVQRRPAPHLGQHNAEVLAEWLALGDEEIAALVGLGVLVDAPPWAG